VQSKAVIAVVALLAGLAGVFGTSYMIGGHEQEHIVEVLIAQFIGNGLLAAILAVLLLR
jgi:cell shape-determining protein MreD